MRPADVRDDAADRPAPPALTPEERVFVDLVDDVLHSAPGLVHHTVLSEAGFSGNDPATFAVVVIETNPAYDLSVGIELARREMRIVVNGRSYPHRRRGRRDEEGWIEQCCRRVEILTAPTLRIVQDTLVGTPVASRLQARDDGTWRTLGVNESGWTAVAAMLVPWSVAFSRKRTARYVDWYRLDAPPDDSPA